MLDDIVRAGMRLLFLMVFMCGASVARAHPAPYSYVDLYLENDGLRGALTIHDFDAAHELGIAEPDALLDPLAAQSQRDRLLDIIEPRLRWQVDGLARAPSWGAIEVLTERQSLRVPFELGTSQPGRVDLKTVLFPYDPQHQTFINIYEAGTLKHQAILDATNDTLTYYSGDAQGRWSLIRTFVASGVHHILIGPDHILFLFGLLLLGGGLRRLALIITSFTVGHSVTLSLAATGLVQIAPRLVEPAIALSIVIVGVDNLLTAPALKPSQPTAVQRDLRPWLAGVFGLIHGFGFAFVLLEFGLPRDALGWSLASFNVGVELGQLAIVLPVAALLELLRRHSKLAAHRVVGFGSAIVILAGAWWFVQRVWFTGVST
jgi:hydrogenase/urease accessory protein HupE